MKRKKIKSYYLTKNFGKPKREIQGRPNKLC